MADAGPEQPLTGRVFVIAHRGASHHAPEHTHPAYERALADGADFLEADLWRSRDGQLVCIHDMTVDRTSDGVGKVAELDVDDLRRLDFGSWFNEAHPDRGTPAFAGLPVVLFDEMLERYSPRQANGFGVRFHVETKYPLAAAVDEALIDGRIEEQVVRLVEKHGLMGSGRVVAQSFWARSLEIVSSLTGGALATALLVAGPGPESLPRGVTVSAPVATALLNDPAYVARMHQQGREVHTWTVDDPQAMRSLVHSGVDGIFTNQPDVLSRLLLEEFPQWSASPARPSTRP